jgi:hypothetical protein
VENRLRRSVRSDPQRSRTAQISRNTAGPTKAASASSPPSSRRYFVSTTVFWTSALSSCKRPSHRKDDIDTKRLTTRRHRTRRTHRTRRLLTCLSAGRRLISFRRGEPRHPLLAVSGPWRRFPLVALRSTRASIPSPASDYSASALTRSAAAFGPDWRPPEHDRAFQNCDSLQKQPQPPNADRTDRRLP